MSAVINILVFLSVLTTINMVTGLVTAFVLAKCLKD